jgi:hypothetical protein
LRLSISLVKNLKNNQNCDFKINGPIYEPVKIWGLKLQLYNFFILLFDSYFSFENVIPNHLYASWEKYIFSICMQVGKKKYFVPEVFFF